jgi:HK97 family phage prohead protease
MTEVRAYDIDLEVRRTATERIVAGIVVPYNVEQRINRSLTEIFLPGAFQAVTRAAHRVKLLTQHDASQLPAGRGQLLREESRGLYGEFYISKTQRGDELLELVADGAVDQFSVGFVPLKDNRRQDGVVERVRAHLAEVSLVTFGAYGEKALVESVRQESETPNLDAVRALLKDLAQ